MGSYVSPDGRRIVKSGGGRSKSEAKAKLKEVLRDYEDGPAIAPSDSTVKDANDFVLLTWTAGSFRGWRRS